MFAHSNISSYICKGRIDRSSYRPTKVIHQPFLPFNLMEQHKYDGIMEEEIWKDIPGWEGLYQASSLGRIKSLERRVWNHKGYKLKGEQVLKPCKNTYRKTPYFYVRLSDAKRGLQKSLAVHVLVCKTFHGPKPESIDGDSNINCMHLNGNSLDNRACNLRWGTHAENMNEETCRASHVAGCPLSKPVIQYDLSGNEIARFPSARTAARVLGLWNVAISECARGNGRYRTHGGYKWKYIDKVTK